MAVCSFFRSLGGPSSFCCRCLFVLLRHRSSLGLYFLLSPSVTGRTQCPRSSLLSTSSQPPPSPCVISQNAPSIVFRAGCVCFCFYSVSVSVSGADFLYLRYVARTLLVPDLHIVDRHPEGITPHQRLCFARSVPVSLTLQLFPQ